MRLAAAVFAFATLSVSHAGVAQPANHIGEPMAQIFLKNGCTMAESDLAATMEAAGWTIGDFQAQVMALYRGGYIETAADGRLKLTGWGDCK